MENIPSPPGGEIKKKGVKSDVHFAPDKIEGTKRREIRMMGCGLSLRFFVFINLTRIQKGYGVLFKDSQPQKELI